MSLKFKCLDCGKDIIIKYLKIGESAKCKSCGSNNVVPESAVETTEDDIIAEDSKTNMTKCPECGASMEVDARFCEECGTELEHSELQKYPGLDDTDTGETRITICPECGAQTEDGASFCKECGAKLEEGVMYCSSCGKKIPNRTGFCAGCGVEVHAGINRNVDSRQRPTSVSVVSWIIIILNALALIVILLAGSALEDSGMSMTMIVLAVIEAIVFVLLGSGLLRGIDSYRLAYLVLNPIAHVISWAVMGFQPMNVLTISFYIIALVVLTRPETVRFFKN